MLSDLHQIAVALVAGSWKSSKLVNGQWQPGYFELDWSSAIKEARLAMAAFREEMQP